MTKGEQLRLCLLLAFQSMLAQGHGAKPDRTAQKAMRLARLMNAFCDLHLPQTFPTHMAPFADDQETLKLDAALNRHIEELQKNEITQLPEDRETLLQFYDRLQQRKARRVQRSFYEQVSLQQLADRVLRYLDEEIEDKHTAGYQ